jgi:hypothetical protein
MIRQSIFFVFMIENCPPAWTMDTRLKPASDG